MLKTIQGWISSRGGWAHALAAAWAAAVAAYAAVPAFYTLVNNVYAATPSWLHELLAAVVGLVAFYTSTTKATASDTPPVHRPPTGGGTQ